jgi:hypothetical protein
MRGAVATGLEQLSARPREGEQAGNAADGRFSATARETFTSPRRNHEILTPATIQFFILMTFLKNT